MSTTTPYFPSVADELLIHEDKKRQKIQEMMNRASKNNEISLHSNPETTSQLVERFKNTVFMDSPSNSSGVFTESAIDQSMTKKYEILQNKLHSKDKLLEKMKLPVQQAKNYVERQELENQNKQIEDLRQQLQQQQQQITQLNQLNNEMLLQLNNFISSYSDKLHALDSRVRQTEQRLDEIKTTTEQISLTKSQNTLINAQSQPVREETPVSLLKVEMQNLFMNFELKTKQWIVEELTKQKAEVQGLVEEVRNIQDEVEREAEEAEIKKKLANSGSRVEKSRLMRSTKELLDRLEAIDATKVELSPFERAKASELLSGITYTKPSLELRSQIGFQAGLLASTRRARDIIGEINRQVDIESDDEPIKTYI